MILTLLMPILDVLPLLPETERDFLTSEQVASIFGVTKKTLMNWLKVGKIPEPKRNPINNYRLWTLADVEAIRNILREKA